MRASPIHSQLRNSSPRPGGPHRSPPPPRAPPPSSPARSFPPAAAARGAGSAPCVARRPRSDNPGREAGERGQRKAGGSAAPHLPPRPGAAAAERPEGGNNAAEAQRLQNGPGAAGVRSGVNDAPRAAATPRRESRGRPTVTPGPVAAARPPRGTPRPPQRQPRTLRHLPNPSPLPNSSQLPPLASSPCSVPPRAAGARSQSGRGGRRLRDRHFLLAARAARQEGARRADMF